MTDLPLLLSSAEVASQLGISEGKLTARIEAGDFPRPAMVAGKKVWSARRIAQYIDQAELEAEGLSMTAIRIPRAQTIHAPLKAFETEQDAYLAGAWFASALHNSALGHKVMRQVGIQVLGSMSTDSNSAGGFTVPDELQRAIVNLRESRGVFPRFSNVVPMSSDIGRYPRLISDVTAAWSEEGGTLTATDPTFGSSEMRTKKLSAFTKTSSELDEDSLIDLGDSLAFSMANAMAVKVDDAAFNGDGTSTYGGVLGLKGALDASAIYDAATGHTGAATLTAADLEGCMGICGSFDGDDCRWYMNRKVYFNLVRLMSGTGMPTTLAVDGEIVPILFGFPVQFVPVMTSTITASPSTILAYFGDLRLGTTYGVRRAARTEISTQRYLELDQIAIKSTERIAIQIHERGATVDARPVVALKTAAS